MSGTLDAAVVGCGDIARKAHIPVYAAHHEVDLVAVADPDDERRRAVAEKHGVARTYDTGAALLDTEDMDIVSICTPVTTHEELFLAAAETGSAIFCVKPFAESLESAERMHRAATKYGLITQVGYMYRFMGNFRRVVELVRSRLLGDVHSLDTQFHSMAPDMDWYYDKDFPGGGVLKRIFCHYLDFYLELFDERPEVTSATVKSVRSEGLEDYAEVEMKFGDVNVSATVGDLQQRSIIHRNHLVGTDGALDFTPRRLHGALHGNEVEYRRGELPAINLGVWRYWRSPSDDYHTSRVEDFVEHVLAGDHETAAPVSRAVAVTAITEEIYRAAGVIR